MQNSREIFETEGQFFHLILRRDSESASDFEILISLSEENVLVPVTSPLITLRDAQAVELAHLLRTASTIVQWLKAGGTVEHWQYLEWPKLGPSKN